MILKEMFGKTMVEARNTGEAIVFEDTEGIRYSLHHDQDCCESVYVEDVIGNLEDLVGSPLLMAESDYNSDEPKKRENTNYTDESFTWTFYKFATVKGYVTIRFYGSSNGYYGETASLHVNGNRVWD
jgi:hypothetical protein